MLSGREKNRVLKDMEEVGGESTQVGLSGEDAFFLSK